MRKKHTSINIYIPKSVEADILKIRQKQESISSHVLDLIKKDLLKQKLITKEEYDKIEIPFLTAGSSRTKANIKYPMLKVYVSEENVSLVKKAKNFCEKKKVPFSKYICELLIKNK